MLSFCKRRYCSLLATVCCFPLGLISCSGHNAGNVVAKSGNTAGARTSTGVTVVPTHMTVEKSVFRTPRISSHAIPNFHVVYPFLWRGAAPTEEGLQLLKASGVKTIIDLRISPKKVAAERQTVAGLNMRFINLPMSGDPPTRSEIKTLLATVTDPAQQPVFVHCQHGCDRTGTMIGIYREEVDHWDFDKTYKEMRRYGFDPHWRRLTATVREHAPN